MNTTVSKLEFPSLAFKYDALEPHIDALTMEIHYSRHHKAYFTNLQNAISGTEMEDLSLEEILRKISKYPTAIRNNGGGHFNHSLFWSVLSPNGGGKPSGELAEAINSKFGSFENFQETFNTTAKTRFGSGWAWLCVKEDNSLFVCSSPNQDNPLMDVAESNGSPILGLDVWEHAYYLKYQNKRPDYVNAFWNVVNWNEVQKRYEQALVG